MSNKKLEELLWGAAEFLRGQIDASDYKQYVFPLCFINACQMSILKNITKRWSSMKAMPNMPPCLCFTVSTFPLKPVGKRSAIP